MIKILAGVFVGVFIGTLGYELVNRSNPELIKKVKQMVSETLEDFTIIEDPDDQEV